jgi:hypothetical protein
MLKIASKFALDIFPSVIATIIGAYIVNHYIVAKPAVGPTAAAVSSAAPKKADLKNDGKPAERSADLGNTPEPGVRAKGISEKSVIDRSAVEKPVVEKPAEKPADKADKPPETASISTDTRRRPANPREKAVAKTIPLPTVEPAVTAPNTAPPVEAAIAPDRDANDLARAAIERLRGTPDSSPRASEVRLPDPPRVVAAPAAPTVSAPSVQPLPPPILVSTPPAETFDAQTKPSYPATARADDPRRPTPPADIPDPKPLDLRADAIPTKPRTNVAEDVLSAAKSMFHSVLPHNSAKEADQDSEGHNRF